MEAAKSSSCAPDVDLSTTETLGLVFVDLFMETFGPVIPKFKATFLSPTAQTTLLFYIITIGSLSGEGGAKDYLHMFYPVRMKLVEYHKK